MGGCCSSELDKHTELATANLQPCPPYSVTPSARLSSVGPGGYVKSAASGNVTAGHIGANTVTSPSAATGAIGRRGASTTTSPTTTTTPTTHVSPAEELPGSPPGKSAAAQNVNTSSSSHMDKQSSAKKTSSNHLVGKEKSSKVPQSDKAMVSPTPNASAKPGSPLSGSRKTVAFSDSAANHFLRKASKGVPVVVLLGSGHGLECTLRVDEKENKLVVSKDSLKRETSLKDISRVLSTPDELRRIMTHAKLDDHCSALFTPQDSSCIVFTFDTVQENLAFVETVQKLISAPKQ